MFNEEAQILADSISYLPHMAAWNKLFVKWFADKDYTKFLIYIVDTVDASALPFLAEQFDCLGYNGWKLATTEAQQRTVIKQSIELHKYKGTPYAVKQALANVGFPDAVLTEHVDGHWAKFRVDLNVGEDVLSDAQMADVIAMIYKYKNTRSWLADVLQFFTLRDTITVHDKFGKSRYKAETDGIAVGVSRFYDGTFNYDGSIDYGGGGDILIVTPL